MPQWWDWEQFRNLIDGLMVTVLVFSVMFRPPKCCGSGTSSSDSKDSPENKR